MHRTVGQRIRDRRKELGLSADYMARALNKNRSTYYRYESSDIENMPINVLTPLAELLQVSEAYLLTGQHDAPTKRVPMLDHVASGDPILAYERFGKHIVMGDGVEADFCLRVKGDGMVDARICDGDLVFVRQQPAVDNGDIAVVLIDDEVTLKRFYRSDSGVILQSENSKYDPMFYSEQDFKHLRVLGRAVMFQSLL